MMVNGKALNRLFVLLALAFIGLFSSISATTAYAQNDEFPALTGRVVDLAELLSEADESALSATLSAHEQSTSNQVVLITVADLNGNDIVDYTNRLARFWGIGTEDKSNGVVLLVAPNARKVRIEVGYGLEGALTDSLSSIIIQREILPSFRDNNYPEGIKQGVTAILQAIAGEYTAPSTTAGSVKTDAFSEKYGFFIPLIFIIIVGLTEGLKRTGYKKASKGAFPAGFAGLFVALGSGNLFAGLGVAVCLFLLIFFKSSNGGGSGGSSTRNRTGTTIGGGFGGSGGGFSGGGGSFGGGGASGGW